MNLEYTDLSTSPSSGKLTSANWADLEPIIRRYLAEPGDTGAFIILSVTDTTYMQSTTCASGFVMEYQIGDTDHHFELPLPSDAATVTALFHAYFENPDDVATFADWEPLELP